MRQSPARGWWWLGLLLLIVGVGPVAAQSGAGHQAGLVIDDGAGNVTTYCIPFDAPEISGLELLERSGRPLTLQTGGVGAAVCRLDGVGCPEHDCFCACRGGDACVYWSYWHWQDGAWRYAPAGAAQVRLRPGDVDGWRWGPGSVTSAAPPPPLSFEDICAAGATAVAAPARAAGPNWPAYVVFVFVVGGLATAIWVAQRRRR